MIVVDASVAVKWVVEEPAREQALLALDLDRPLIAPDLVLAEFASVMRRKLRMGEAVRVQIGAGLTLLREAISQFVPTDRLIDDALIIAEKLDHSPYDCLYLACALGKGHLLTADERFLAKCRANGYGRLVLGLNDLADGRLVAMTAETAIGEDVLDAIKRLVPLIDQTKETLFDAAPGEKLGRLKLVSGAIYDPVYEAPAYVQLQRKIEQLPPEQLALLLALGWIGRHEAAGQIQALINNAEILDLTDFDQHGPYIMAQIEHVPAGLAKLREHYDITD